MTRRPHSQVGEQAIGGAAAAAEPVLFAIGFRPFFLLAALFAALLVPAWLAILLLPLPWRSPLPPATWHAHEMLFGYTSAVIAGFLLTAAQNWTGQVTARGRSLAALCALWLAGRIASTFGAGPSAWLAAALDLAFLPALALCVARPIARARNTRNAAMPLILLALAAGNAPFWTGALLGDPIAMLRGQRVTLDLIALLIVVIGARIIPNFTQNAIAGLRARKANAFDKVATLAMVALLASDAIAPQAGAAAHCALLAGCLQLSRLWGWGGSRAWSRPILSVLHVGYASTALGLVLRGVSPHIPQLTESVATHLLTVGGIGLMTLGMMARVALGHTGRPLELAPSVSLALGLLATSAVVRVLGPPLVPTRYVEVLLASATLWTLAFALYLFRYAPILVTKRADGRPG